MSLLLPHVRQAITSRPWAIMPERAGDIAAVIERRAVGVRLTPEQIAELKGPRDQANGMLTLFGVVGGEAILPLARDAEGRLCVSVGGEVQAFSDDDERAQRVPGPTIGAGPPTTQPGGAVGVINVFGIIAQHASQVDDVSGPGGTSTERVGASLDMALADPGIKAIVLNVDSPGGNVHGVQELADRINAARGQKPIVAVANGLAASAAYWIASAADEVVVAPGGLVGNIGAYSLHEDLSVALEQAGIKYTFISAGKFKVEGNSVEPLNPEARDAIQSQVDAYYRDFVKAVARGRGVKAADVVNGFGEGRVVKDHEAVKAGMADRVATLNDTIRRLANGRTGRGGGSSASARRRAAPINMRSIAGEDGSCRAELVGEWPALALIDLDAVRAGAFADAVGISEGPDETMVGIHLANASATYLVEPDDGTGLHGSVCRLMHGQKIASRAPTEPGQEGAKPPAAPNAPEDGQGAPGAPETTADASDASTGEDPDAYRRRRHAHRLRGA